MSAVTKDNLAELFDPSGLRLVDGPQQNPTFLKGAISDEATRVVVLHDNGQVYGVLIRPGDYDKLLTFLGLPILMESFADRTKI